MRCRRSPAGRAFRRKTRARGGVTVKFSFWRLQEGCDGCRNVLERQKGGQLFTSDVMLSYFYNPSPEIVQSGSARPKKRMRD